MPHTQSVQMASTQDTEQVSRTFSVTANSREDPRPSVPAAKTGSLTTRTDNDTGTFTMTSGHGFSTSDKIDLFWSGGKRRNMTATVTGDSVVLDGGTGDNLPDAATAITTMKPVEIDFVVSGDDVIGLQASCPAAGFIVVVYDDSGPTDGPVFSFTGAGGFAWTSDMVAAIGYTNPLAGLETLSAKFSHGSTSAIDMKLIALFGAA